MTTSAEGGVISASIIVLVLVAAAIGAMTAIVLVVNAAIASIAGSLAAHDLWGFTGLTTIGMLGALAGLLSAVLMAMLMITYHATPSSKR